MKKIFLMVWVALLPALAGAQQFAHYYPTTYDRTARDIVRTASGEYLIVGSSNNSDPADSDLYVLLTDAGGNFLWDTVYGGAKPDYAYHMVETDDGNYIVVGYTQSFGPGDYDIYLLKLSPKGKKLGERAVNFGGKNEEARQVIRTADNKYLVIGTTGMGSTSTKPDMVLLKINNDLSDAAGAKTFDGDGEADYGLCIAEAADGGYFIGGQTRKPSNGMGDAFVIKLPSDLSAPEWKKNYGDTYDEEVVGIVGNSDGSAMLAIRDSLPGQTADGNINVHLLGIDGNGAPQGQGHVYGDFDKDTPKSIMPVSTGGYIVGAISRSWWQGAPQMWLIRAKADGSQDWIMDYGDVYEHDHCHMAKESHDGGFIVVGHQRKGATRVAFLKLNAQGYVGVGEQGVAQSLNLFPNPCSDKVTLVCPADGELDVELLDVMGRSWHRQTAKALKGGSLELEIQGVPAGIYIVNIRSADQVHCSRLVVDR